jgi:hypothetical protein
VSPQHELLLRMGDPLLALTKTDIGAMTSAFPAAYGEQQASFACVLATYNVLDCDVWFIRRRASPRLTSAQ